MLMRDWNLSRLFNAEEAGAGEGSGGGGDAGGSTAAAPATESASTSEYSATDPGYGDAVEESDDPLADLKAENTTNKGTPADDEPADAAGDSEESNDAKAETTGDSAEDDFSDGLLDRAVALGYTVADIKSFRSEKSLAKEVERVERLQQRVASRQAPAPAPTPEVQPEAIAEPNWQALIDEGHDPQMIAFQQQSWQRALAAEQRAMQAEQGIQQLAQLEQQRANKAFFEGFDSTIGQLGEEYESLIGTGTIQEIRASNPAQAAQISANRQQVLTEFADLKQRMTARGERLPPDKELIERAVHSAFWKQTKSLARKELTNDIKKAGSQALSRPRSAGRQSLTGSAAATDKESQFWKKFDS